MPTFWVMSNNNYLLDNSKEYLLCRHAGCQSRIHPTKRFNYSEELIIKMLPNDGYYGTIMHPLDINKAIPIRDR